MKPQSADSEPNRNTAASSDHSLLRAVQSGEAHAATELYLRYVDHLRTLAARQTSGDLATRLDPDDIVQSVFRTFFRRVSSDQYEVPQGEDLWKLLLVIALHKIRNAASFHRAAKRDVRQTVAAEGIPIADRDETGLAVLRMVIDGVLEQLPETSRQIVRLRIDGFEMNEIVQRTGRSKRSVERVLQQFRDQLKGLLDEDD